MNDNDDDDGAYGRLRAHLTGLPPDERRVEMSLTQIGDLIGSPLVADGPNPIDTPSDLPPAMTRALRAAGFGVAEMVLQSDSEDSAEVILHLVRGLHRWPDIAVDSQAFAKTPPHARLHELASAYLESGKLLCVQLADNPSQLTWPRSAPASFCYRHALELFIKSCILHRQPVAKCDHNISGLLKQYDRLFPGDAYRIYTEPELPDLVGPLGIELAAAERNPDQVLRYFADKRGGAPHATYGFSPKDCYSRLEQLERDMTRIWRAILDDDSG